MKQSLAELKRRLAETLARSKLDYTDHLLILNAFFRDMRWSEGAVAEQAAQYWRRLFSGEPPPEHILSLYIHIPYCTKKCHFCYCSVKSSPSRAMVDGYVPELKKEIAYFAPLFHGAPVTLFQIGGGTPNLLSARQLSELLEAVPGHFTLDEGGMRTIEFNPSGTTPEKLKVLRRAGFNRISFGVQSLNAAVLERENREYQTYKMTRDAVRWAQEAGFDIVNVDLLLGLDSDTAAGFLESVGGVASLKPTMITVTGLSLTDAYIKVMKTGRENKLRHYEALLPEASEGVRRLGRRYGYDVSDITLDHANWILRAVDMPQAVFDRLVRGDHFEGGSLSILGLGQLAWSHAFGQSIYERYPEPFAAGKPLYRTAPMSLKEEMMRYILYALETGSRVSFKPFKKRFARDVRREFSVELKALKAFGKISLDEQGFSYLPVRGPARIFFGLVFLLDTLSQSPFSRGTLGAPLRARLARELADVELGSEVAA